MVSHLLFSLPLYFLHLFRIIGITKSDGDHGDIFLRTQAFFVYVLYLPQADCRRLRRDRAIGGVIPKLAKRAFFDGFYVNDC